MLAAPLGGAPEHPAFAYTVTLLSVTFCAVSLPTPGMFNSNITGIVDPASNVPAFEGFAGAAPVVNGASKPANVSAERCTMVDHWAVSLVVTTRL